MALAHRLHKTLSEIGALSLEEIALHQAYLLDHDPEWRRDHQFALLTAVTANAGFRGDGDRTSEEYLTPPRWKRAEREETEIEEPEEQQEEALVSWAKVWNARMGKKT